MQPPKEHSCVHTSYDVAIIGAGIGGLVCGCALAKAGLKVLIAERHHSPGGYCSSFTRKGLTFDAAAHSIGGLRYGNLSSILDQLGISARLCLKQFDPSNVIVAPGHRVAFWADLDKTILDFSEQFPAERTRLRQFFTDTIHPDLRTSLAMKTATFDTLLNRYFRDEKLKAMLSFPLLLNGGLPPSMISAFIGSKIFKEFLLGGGFYPDGGMQSFSDSFAARFRELGGDLLLSCGVKKIGTEAGSVTGILLDSGEWIDARYVVSNCDARTTFLSLLGPDTVDAVFTRSMQNMIPSLSAFVLYIGKDTSGKEFPNSGTNLWHLAHYNLDAVYRSFLQMDFEKVLGYLLFVYPDQKRLLAFVSAPFLTEDFWRENKKRLRDAFLGRIERDMGADVTRPITFKDASTPVTLHRYTGNYQGASFGWACTPSQLALSDFKRPSFVHGLYLTGHWTTTGLGIPGVVYGGYDTAAMILRKAVAH